MNSTLNALAVTHSQLRYDILPPGHNDMTFPEGWREMNQFYPRYYQPSGTIQVFLKNDTAAPLQDIRLKLNGKPVEDLTTRADYAGPVIWHRINPEVIPPGGTAMVYIRLREQPEKAPVVTVNAREVTVPLAPAPFRIAYAALNETLDTMNIYILRDSATPTRLKEAFVDGVPAKIEAAVNPDFAAKAPAYLKVKCAAALRHGQYFELKLSDGAAVAAVQLRALPSRFLLGMVGGNSKLYAAKLFNLNYILHGGNDFPGNFKPDTQILWRPVTNEAGILQTAQQLPPDKFIYGNADEPDAHEPPGLPYMQRCGINIMRQVEPVMRLQRKLDPYHPTSVMIDRTYAPHNWYTYGEVPDLPFNDCYSPTQWMGMDSYVVAQTLPFLLNAFGPRPVNLMLWACTNTGHQVKRAPTPAENDMQVLYALGAGVKGLHYFVDWTSFPQRFEGGFYTGASQIKPLWKQLGRNNARILRLEPFLLNSYPLDITASSDSAKLWSGALMSGASELLVFVVNRNIKVPGTDRITFPYQQSTSGEITVTLPPWFKFSRAVRVDWDKVTPANLTPANGTLRIPVENLHSGFVLVLSSDPAIADRLQLPDAQMAALLDSEKPFKPEGTLLEPVNTPANIITLPDSGKMQLDFGRETILRQLNRMTVSSGRAYLVPGQMLALYPEDKPLESSIELIFKFKSGKPVTNLRAALQGENALGYHANIQLELIDDQGKIIRDTTFKPEWFSGRNKRETLSVQSPGPLPEFTIRIELKTPNIVYSDEYAALARTLTLTWE